MDCKYTKKTGALIVAAVEFIFGLLSLIPLILVIIHMDTYGRTIFILGLFYSQIAMWVCILLIIGIQTKRTNLLFTWLLWTAFRIWLFLISIPVITIYAPDIRVKLKRVNISLVVVVVILVLIFIRNCFSTVVVWGYYKELRKEISKRYKKKHGAHGKHGASHPPKRNQIVNITITKSHPTPPHTPSKVVPSSSSPKRAHSPVTRPHTPETRPHTPENPHHKPEYL